MKTYQLDLTEKQLKALETAIITYGDDILNDGATMWTRSEKKALGEVFKLVTATRVLGARLRVHKDVPKLMHDIRKHEFKEANAGKSDDLEADKIRYAHGKNHIVPLAAKGKKS